MKYRCIKKYYRIVYFLQYKINQIIMTFPHSEKENKIAFLKLKVSKNMYDKFSTNLKNNIKWILYKHW